MKILGSCVVLYCLVLKYNSKVMRTIFWGGGSHTSFYVLQSSYYSDIKANEL